MLLARLPVGVFISRRGAEARSLGFDGKRPLSPIAKQGRNSWGDTLEAVLKGRRHFPAFRKIIAATDYCKIVSLCDIIRA